MVVARQFGSIKSRPRYALWLRVVRALPVYDQTLLTLKMLIDPAAVTMPF